EVTDLGVRVVADEGYRTGDSLLQFGKTGDVRPGDMAKGPSEGIAIGQLTDDAPERGMDVALETIPGRQRAQLIELRGERVCVLGDRIVEAVEQSDRTLVERPVAVDDLGELFLKRVDLIDRGQLVDAFSSKCTEEIRGQAIELRFQRVDAID